MNRLITRYIVELTYASLIFFCLSCNSGKKNPQPTPAATDDLVETAAIDKPVPVDSSILEKQNVVFGDIRFGISRKQYNNIIKDSLQEVGSYKYIFFPKFNVLDQLYELSIRSIKREDWDSACDKIADLNKKIFQFYPEANYVNKNFSYLNSKPGFIALHVRWNIGEKEIVTGALEEEETLGDHDYVNVYRAVCKISNKTLSNNLGHENDKKDDSTHRLTPGKF